MVMIPAAMCKVACGCLQELQVENSGKWLADATHVTESKSRPLKVVKVLIVEDTDEGILIREAHMN